MRYEHTPRPEIEHHYYIQGLIESQEKRTADRLYHRNRLKTLEERNDLIKDNKPLELKDFFCTDCNKDFFSVAVKQEEVDWSNPTQTIAFYKTKCWCGKWCIRYITDKNADPFWTKSRRMRAEHAKYAIDLLQPHETGFNLQYGKR